MKGTEIIWMAFGNQPVTRVVFVSAFVSLNIVWNTKQIDSRTVEGSNKSRLKLGRDYGEDSDFLKVHVRGVSRQHQNYSLFQQV